MTAPDARGLARQAVETVPADPARGRTLARQALAEARRCGDPVAQSLAERACGVADVHFGRLAGATARLRRAVSLAEGVDAGVAADARISLAFALTRQGDLRGAVEEISGALGDLTGEQRAAGLAQRAAIQQHLGHLDAAAADYAQALPVLRAAADRVRVQRILSNRGVLHAFRHEYDQAARDLAEALALCRELGLTLGQAYVHENLVLVHRRLGDVEAALKHLGRADRLYRDLGMPTGTLRMERSELLSSIGHWAEAREAAEAAVVEFRRARRRISVPEARLLVAHTALRSGAPQLALREARCARRQLAAQERTRFVALADCLILRAEHAHPARRDPDARELSRAARAADGAGWPDAAAELRLLIGRSALAAGPRAGDVADRELRLVAAHRHQGPSLVRVRAWYAAALLHALRNDDAAAARAAASGLAVLEEFRTTIHATDLRAGLSAVGVDLAAIGVDYAVKRHSPRLLFAWAERSRARQLLQPPASARPNSILGQRLSQLRALTAEVDQRRAAGEDVTHLVKAQVAAEHELRDLGRSGHAGPGETGEPWTWPRLFGALRGDALVQFVEARGTLYALTVVDGRVRRREVGTSAAVGRLARWFPFGLRRLAGATGRTPGSDAAAQLVRRQAAQVEELVLAPLGHLLGDRRLVIVPTGPLHSLPWSLLPSLRGRPVTVAPSSALWLRTVERSEGTGKGEGSGKSEASGQTERLGGVVVVAGPGLAGAVAEADAVAAIHGSRRPLTGERAGHREVIAALADARLAHLAAHGRVRRDNPLLSHITLADGPVSVYDLELADRLPDTVVLAACDVGDSVVLAGDELLGLAAGFLTRGSRHVVASVVPVPDAATQPLMVALHQRLADGAPVAEALADAQLRLGDDHPAALAAAAGFCCFGAGLTSGSPSDGRARTVNSAPAPMSVAEPIG